MEQIFALLIPLGCGCVLPIVVIWLGIRQKMNEELAKNTGNDVEKVAADTERDNYMTAQQALDYGIIDEIIAPRR